MNPFANTRQPSAGSDQSLHDLESLASTPYTIPNNGNERFRNIEILKYGSSLRINYGDDKFVPADPTAPRLGGDAVLTGLCQLFTLRMGCSNGFVCLNDVKKQHIIAEATKTVSPYDASVHAPNDGILFGIQSFDHAFGISQITLPAYTQGQQHFVTNHYTSIDNKRSIFLDLNKEPLISRFPFVQSDSGKLFHFYLETPLRNAAGMVVGILGVLDDKPCSSFQDVNVQPMLDAAQMVIEHLELVRLRDLNTRAERLMQGLSHFNVGQSSIEEWVKGGPTLPLDPVAVRPIIKRSHSQMSLTTTTTKRSNGALTATTPSTQPEKYFDSAIASPVTDPSITPFFDFNARPRPVTRMENANDSESIFVEETVLVDSMQPATNIQSKQTDSGNYETFARASNLICESMDLRGTCFLGVPLDTRMYPAGRTIPHKVPPRNAHYHENSILESTNSNAKQETSDSQSASDVSDDLGATLCKCIAFTTRLSSSSVSDPAARSGINITRSVVDKLITKYPAGHIFQFGITNSASSGDESAHAQRSGARVARPQKLIKILSSNFPSARSLLFVPLYDYEQQKLHSAFFGWTDDVYRILVDSDAVYVAAFANSIMCEVMRLETIALEKAKSVFMSSISHELRSPLHGILAATDLLRESHLETDQNELALMVDSCGRTLLDIMNNLLEHAKINNMIDNSKRARKRKKGSNRVQRLRSIDDRNLEVTSEPINIAEILEETIVSVASGHVSKIQGIEQFSASMRHVPVIVRDRDTLESSKIRAPLVVLNIHKSENWAFQLDAGSWRRIVMNLVGNALKYTASGHIEVSLSTFESMKKSNRPQRQLVLTVADTGLGMSETYMKNKLYIPFSQEDQLSPGVGLGLSIVNRLVLSLGGKISVESEINVGTNIKVVIPLPPSDQPERSVSPIDRESIASANVAISDSKSACLCGFDILPALASVPTGIMSSHALSLLKLKQSLSTMMNAWFEIRIEQNSFEADFCIMEASYAHALLMRDPFNAIFQKRYIVVYAYDFDRSSNQSWPGCSNTITMPIGPFKLARAIETVFKQGLSPKVQIQKQYVTSVPVAADTAMRGGADIVPVASSNGGSSVCTMLLESSSSHGNTRVLLVDDNNINVRILVGLVRNLKLSYSTACNGQDALNKYITAYKQGQPFQYIFMDVSMPVMDGLTSTRCIRTFENENPDCTPTQIFVLTGLGHIDTQEEAVASGADQYLRKPVRLNILRSLLPTQ